MLSEKSTVTVEKKDDGNVVKADQSVLERKSGKKEKLEYATLSRRRKEEVERREKEVKEAVVEAIKQLNEEEGRQVSEQTIKDVVQQVTQPPKEKSEKEHEEQGDEQVSSDEMEKEQDDMESFRATGVLEESIVRVAKAIAYYIRPKDLAKYTIAFMPSPDHTYELPEQFFKVSLLVSFNFRKRRIHVYSQEEQIHLGWIKLTDELERLYRDAVDTYKATVRAVLKNSFLIGSEKFASAANVR